MPDSRADAPVLDAFDVGDGSCAAWCDHCCAWHSHGKSYSLIHVAAHCAWIHPWEAPLDYLGNSPYVETGYWLKPAGPATPEILRDITCQQPPWPVRH